ncbi:iron(III) transport system ATP-binding protein [Algoriphagus boseongensis]|uniref:Iron(III) transport system ATP-binding protein n=1 Tax=Algoriphagus boseongensis TaxID=1442587 RepID=A0A4R6T4I3_9BACT|nr:ABC transporter ATP-binding protein [Algoriphagus boseongensis]TDQ16652.1 iron(III) transport system ATP-binding protein [Algoriphagus boseongensis]
MSYFSLRQITKTYDSQTALQEFTLELEKGEMIAIVGESGSGKSTLLRIAAGLTAQTSGEVWLGDQKILNPSQKLVPGYDEIKLIHQDYQLFPAVTVEENIARPLLQFDVNYREQRIQRLLDQLGLNAYKERLPRQLSGGQQQKVAIAQALAVEPEVLLLDEPFSHLDAIQKRKLILELKELLQEMGTTVIFVTHDLDDALRLTDSVVILQKGKVVQKGNSKDLCEHPKSRYVARLFSSINLIPDRFNSYIRPSDIRLRTKGEILGHVIDSRFLVHYNSLLVRLKNGGEIWEVDDPVRKYKIGDRVYLHFDEEKVLVLKS